MSTLIFKSTKLAEPLGLDLFYLKRKQMAQRNSKTTLN